MKKFMSSLLLVLACSATAARAQSTVVATASDLILGFHATNPGNGAGTDKNLEIDLGNVGQFYNLAANTTVTLGNLRADLESVYDVVWNARDDLSWGLAGTTGSATGTTIGGVTIAAKTLWAGKTETTAGVQATAWNRGSTFAQQGTANTIAALYTGATGSLNGKTSTTNSATSTVLDNSTSGSWSKQEGTTAAAFGGFNPASSFDASTDFLSIVGSFAVIDLFELQPGSGAGVYKGSFALSNDGVLQFSNNAATFALSAIPEPSAFAALLGAAMLALAAVRRRAPAAGFAARAVQS